MIPLYNEEEFQSAKSKDKLPCKCKYCKTKFFKIKSEIQSIIKNSEKTKRTGDFCSKKCLFQFLNNQNIIKCKNCNKKVHKAKYQIKENNFCSKSCSAAYNNKRHPPRKIKPTNICKKCNKRIRGAKNKSNLCRKCSSIQRTLDFGEKQIKDFSSTYARHKYQNVRIHAHRIANIYDLNKYCSICKYDIHVELAHIKGISEFDKDTKLKIVNSKNNLVYLCRNHHWEIEHNLIKL